MFDGSYYLLWTPRMEAYLKTLEDDVWNTIENGYTPPKSRRKGATTMKLHKFHVTTRNEILNSLSNGEKDKIGHYTSGKEILVN